MPVRFIRYSLIFNHPTDLCWYKITLGNTSGWVGSNVAVVLHPPDPADLPADEEVVSVCGS
jgi:hypothetical protein